MQRHVWYSLQNEEERIEWVELYTKIISQMCGLYWLMSGYSLYSSATLV